MIRPCPTPAKRGRYATEAEAEQDRLAIVERCRRQGKYEPVRSYLCCCGTWHHSSQPKRSR